MTLCWQAWGWALNLDLLGRITGQMTSLDTKQEGWRMQGTCSKRHGCLQLSVSVSVTSIPGISDYPPVPCPRPVSGAEGQREILNALWAVFTDLFPEPWHILAACAYCWLCSSARMGGIYPPPGSCPSSYIFYLFISPVKMTGTFKLHIPQS